MKRFFVSGGVRCPVVCRDRTMSDEILADTVEVPVKLSGLFPLIPFYRLLELLVGIGVRKIVKRPVEPTPAAQPENEAVLFWHREITVDDSQELFLVFR